MIGGGMMMFVLHEEKGSMTIETAIVLPLLIFLLLSIISAGLYLHDTYVDDVRAIMGTDTEQEELLIQRGTYPIFIPGISDLEYSSRERQTESVVQLEVKKQWEIFYILDVAFYYAERLSIVQEILDKKEDVIDAIMDIIR